MVEDLPSIQETPTTTGNVNHFNYFDIATECKWRQKLH